MPTYPPSTAPVRLPDESPQGARIKVVGVGGGGSNAIDRMIDFGVEGVEFIALNTDVQALEVSKAPVRGQLGSLLTNGLSAGSDPNVGRRAAIQDVNEIAEVLEGADMVFITAGLGGGTGTGAAPVIAAIAAEMGALTVAIVTRPFNFEGKRRMAIADWGIDHLLRYVDTLIVIPNEKLLDIAKDAPFFESFKIADDFLRQAVQGISDIITTEGVINRDFADVKTTMAGMGYAVMGTASRSGPNRAVDAVMDAMASPLLEEGAIDGARGILINITGSSSLRLSEVNAASRVIQSVAHEDANIIFGAVLDERLGDEVKATVIATGFRNDGRDRSERRARLLRAAGPEPARPTPATPVLMEPEATEPEAEPETSPLLASVDEAPLAESLLPHKPETVDVTFAGIEALEEVKPEEIEPEEEPIETIVLEAGPAEVAETAFEEPSVEVLEVEQALAIQDQMEEAAPHLDLAMDVDEEQETQVEDPPQHAPVEVVEVEVAQETENAQPAEFEPGEELAAEEEARPGLHDEEQDWREAIREIARLAEPVFAVDEEDSAKASEPGPWNRPARSPAGPAASGIERSPNTIFHDDSEQDALTPKATNRSAPPKDRVPSAPAPAAASPLLSNTRRAALAAYAAISLPEVEIEPAEPETKPVNAFAQVLEARRRFVENLGTKLPSQESSTSPIATPPEAPELTPPSQPLSQELSRRYQPEEAWPESEPLRQRQARPVRPLTIDAQPTQSATWEREAGSRDELLRRSNMQLFRDTVAGEPSETGHPDAEDPPKPHQDLNRRLQRESAEPRNGELFESRWNSKIPVPSFGSILDRKSYTEELDDLDTP
jgi:cell division protein FtsZ